MRKAESFITERFLGLLPAGLSSTVHIIKVARRLLLPQAAHSPPPPPPPHCSGPCSLNAPCTARQAAQAGLARGLRLRLCLCRAPLALCTPHLSLGLLARLSPHPPPARPPSPPAPQPKAPPPGPLHQ
jgi:hypothetical protein